MNLESLRRHARWADKIANAQRELADELAKELTRAQGHNDPLGLHIYQSRARFRQALENDHKSGKRTEATLRESFLEARKLGFGESGKIWALLMGWGEPASESTGQTDGR